MTNLETSRLTLVPLSRAMIERRMAEDDFGLWIAHVAVVDFPHSWPGGAMAMFPTSLERGYDPVEDIWVAVKFILECDYFNGRTIDVDGGLSM